MVANKVNAELRVRAIEFIIECERLDMMHSHKVMLVDELIGYMSGNRRPLTERTDEELLVQLKASAARCRYLPYRDACMRALDSVFKDASTGSDRKRAALALQERARELVNDGIDPYERLDFFEARRVGAISLLSNVDDFLADNVVRLISEFEAELAIDSMIGGDGNNVQG